LTPTLADIFENEIIDFNCTYSTQVSLLIWNKYTKESNYTATVINDNGTCKLYGFNKTTHSVTCPTLYEMILRISNVTRQQHGQKLNCEDGNNAKSDLSTIYVRGILSISFIHF
jgi:hypothetical protein